MEDGSNPAAHRRHLAMLERLSKRQPPSAAPSGSSSLSHSADAAAFFSRFADARRDIESTLSHLRSLPAEDPSLAAAVADAAAAVSDLDRLLAESSHLLPPYDLRSALSSAADLRAAVDSLLPKKRFTFRTKNAKKTSRSSDISSELNPATDTAISNGGSSELQHVGGERSNAAHLHAGPGFRSKNDASLVKDFTCSGFGEGDFTLDDLENCRIYLKGALRTLFIHKLKGCQVYVGPVLGSVLIEDAQDCVFVIASHQIRIHKAKNTDFYLRVRSRPIIEDSHGVRFAPYVLVYEGITEGLRQSDLSEETGNWANVDDFKWLRSSQSPNWCLIPEEERSGTIDISEVKDTVVAD